MSPLFLLDKSFVKTSPIEGMEKLDFKSFDLVDIKSAVVLLIVEPKEMLTCDDEKRPMAAGLICAALISAPTEPNAPLMALKRALPS